MGLHYTYLTSPHGSAKGVHVGKYLVCHGLITSTVITNSIRELFLMEGADDSTLPPFASDEYRELTAVG